MRRPPNIASQFFEGGNDHRGLKAPVGAKLHRKVLMRRMLARAGCVACDAEWAAAWPYRCWEEWRGPPFLPAVNTTRCQGPATAYIATRA